MGPGDKRGVTARDAGQLPVSRALLSPRGMGKQRL